MGKGRETHLKGDSQQDLRVEIPDQDYNEGPPPNRTRSTPPNLAESPAVNPLDELNDTQSVDLGPRYKV